jgi:hypothetical protein
MTISQEQKDIDAARPLIGKCELKRVRLRRCSADLQGEEIGLKAPFGLAHSHNTTASLIDNLLRIEVAYNFQGFDASESKASLFSVQCVFDLDYEISDAKYRPEQEAINAFKDGNALFNCWPYARECLQSITSRMALTPPPLPLLRIVTKPKSEDNTSSEATTSALKE